MLSGRRSLRRPPAGTLRRAGRVLRQARAVVGIRAHGLPEADALVLLPALPATGAVVGPGRRWAGVLPHWGVAVVPASEAELVLGRGPAVLATGRPPAVIAPGADRWRRLRRAGYSVTTYRVRWLTWQVVVAAPDRRALALARRTWAAGRPGAAGVRGLLARAVRPRALTVATRGAPPVPGPLTAAGLPTRGGCLAVDVRDQRRRGVLLVPDGVTGEPSAVVKIDRAPGVEDRAVHEQRVLGLLPPGPVTPAPLGTGRAGPVRWSAETVLRGRPMDEVVTEPGAPVREVLGHLADWLGEVAARTAGPVDWATAGKGDEVVALRGRAADLRPLLCGLGGVPAVLTHGDLASGHNVLVDRDGRPAVLDWETARERGLPLLDLLPLLCWTLARTRGEGNPHREAARILDLATGRSPDSAWLFDEVARYTRRLAIPPDLVGRLALLAWGHQASMRSVRDELLTAAGLPVRPWVNTGELVLDAWSDEIGPEWAAARGVLG
ncbi:phosphotransferase [Geodermatophilus sp. SYSU D00684]